jgi:hypothetical protein
MPGRDEIRDLILGAAAGATGGAEALGARVEDFDVEVRLAGDAEGVTAVIRFSIVPVTDTASRSAA